VSQTEARKTLKDAPLMWRRINSIGIIIDCNSTYAKKLEYSKSEIIGKSIFEHVSKEALETMNNSLKTWFDTGKVSERKITFRKRDGTTFPVVLYASSLYDEKNQLMGSNTIIFDINEINDQNITIWEKFIQDSQNKLEKIRKEQYEKLDENSKSEYDGLKKMFDMLEKTDFKSMQKTQ